MSVNEHHIRVPKRARYYTIGSTDQTSDIWIVCHGYGQLAGRFITNFECIAAQRRLIVAPEALHRFYLDPPPAPAVQRRVGATWMTREDRETDIADYIDYLDLLISEIVSNAPAARLHVLGFSQGTATILRWVASATRVPDHLIVWAGEVPQDVDWAAAARKLAKTRIDVVHGSRDELTARDGLSRNLRALDEVGLKYHKHEFEGGHRLDDATLVRLANL